MVLETRLISLITILICSSCNADSDIGNITDKAVISGHTLILTESNNSCKLQIQKNNKKNTYSLLPKAPCYFLRRGSETPQSVAYDDVQVLSTLIVIGSPIAQEKRKKWNIDSNMTCGELAQGVLIKNTGLEVTSKTLEGGVFCRDTGSDEKNFWYLAH
mgnify:CR=1 FL=1